MKITDKRNDKDTEEIYEDHDVVVFTDDCGDETLGMIYCVDFGDEIGFMLGFLNDEDKYIGMNFCSNTPSELIDNILSDPDWSFKKAKKVKAELIIK